MKHPKTKYVEDLATATDEYLESRQRDARSMAIRIRHRQTSNEWYGEHARITQEIERRATVVKP